MPEDHPNTINRLLKQAVRRLLGVGALWFAILFLVFAVVISVMIVLTIDLLWDGRLNAEMEFAGVVTPFLDGLFLVVFITAMLNEIREEIRRRKAAEEAVRKLNENLETKVAERTRQLFKAQDELLRKEKLAVLGKIAGNVGHELRNPLGVIGNAVYFLQTVLADADDTTKEYLGIIRDEIAGAEHIVSDLLDSVRNKLPHRESVAARELINQALRKCKLPADIRVKPEIPEALPPVLADPLQIQQVLRNLIGNGIEAMPDGGILEIRASAATAERTVTISVRDSGCGIAPEHLDKLFQPLFSTKARGVGLGLMVVKNLTEANGGGVEVRSEPGRGSTFSVTLPTADVDAELVQ